MSKTLHTLYAKKSNQQQYGALEESTVDMLKHVPIWIANTKNV